MDNNAEMDTILMVLKFAQKFKMLKNFLNIFFGGFDQTVAIQSASHHERNTARTVK